MATEDQVLPTEQPQPIDQTQLVTEHLIVTLTNIDQSLSDLNKTLGYFGENLTVYLKAINDELSYRNKHLS